MVDVPHERDVERDRRDDPVEHRETVELADAIRGLIDATRLSVAPAGALVEARRLVVAARGLLDPYRVEGTPAQASIDGAGIGLGAPLTGEPADYFPYSPIVGPRNPVAPPIRLWANHKRVHGEMALGAAYAGPPGLVHGGVIALVFDELLGACAIVNEAPGFTGTLTVRYLRGTPVLRPVTMEAWVDRIEGRKTFVTGELYAGDHVTATATGIFIAAAHQASKP